MGLCTQFRLLFVFVRFPFQEAPRSGLFTLHQAGRCACSSASSSISIDSWLQTKQSSRQGSGQGCSK
jgi:hypothetical protein